MKVFSFFIKAGVSLMFFYFFVHNPEPVPHLHKALWIKHLNQHSHIVNQLSNLAFSAWAFYILEHFYKIIFNILKYMYVLM